MPCVAPGERGFVHSCIVPLRALPGQITCPLFSAEPGGPLRARTELCLSISCQFGSVQLLSHVHLFVSPWTATHQASLSITNSWGLLKLMSTELVMPSNHLILCHPLLLLPSIFPSIRVFSNELVLHIRWSKYWSFSFSISPSNEYSEYLCTSSNLQSCSFYYSNYPSSLLEATCEPL